MAAARTCLFLQAGAHTVVILTVIVLLLDLRVTVAQQLNMANKSVLVAKERSLKGREEKMVVAGKFCLS